MKRVDVDYELCQGHGRCYALAPEYFEAKDDYGYAEYTGGPLDDGNPEAIARVEEAIANCPEYALSWTTGPEGSRDDVSEER